IATLFPQGDLTPIDDLSKLEKDVSSLERICQNSHYKSQSVSSSASGCDASECQQIISTEALKQLNESSERGVLERLKLLLGSTKHSEVEAKRLEKDN